MKTLLLFLFLITSLQASTQALPAEPASNGKKVSFTTTIDSANATKDGIYINGYVVNLSSAEITRLHGKKVKISGKVSVVKGTGNQTEGEITQGRTHDAMHMLKPKIKVL